MQKQLKRSECRVDERSESTSAIGGFRCAHPPYELRRFTLFLNRCFPHGYD